MDAFFPKYVSPDKTTNHPQLEDYGDLLSQIEQAKEHHPALSFPAFRQQNPTPESLVGEGLEHRTGQRVVSRGVQPIGMYPTPGLASLQQQQQQQWTGETGLQPEMTPESQHDGSFSPESHASNHGRHVAMAPTQTMSHLNQWPDLDNVFNANIDQAASFQIPQQSFVEEMMMASQQPGARQTHGQMAYGNFNMDDVAGSHMLTLDGSMEDMSPGSDGFDLQQAHKSVASIGMRSAQDAMHLQQGHDSMEQHQQQQQQQQQQEEAFGGDDRPVIAQPMAIHGGGAGQSSHVNHLNAQAERMGSKEQPMQKHVPMTASGPQFTSSDAGASRSGSTAAQSPTASDSSQDGFPEMMLAQQQQQRRQQQQQQQQNQSQQRQLGGNPLSARRPSMTTDLARGMTHVHLQTESPDLAFPSQPMFKKPSIPQGATLAERRRQQLPNGLNVQRPKGLNLSRAFSSSAIAPSAPVGGRFPTSPHATLRRNKSSNVVAGTGGVLSGRIQKAASGSARNSPLVASFPEETKTSQQAGQNEATPPTATSTMPQFVESQQADATVPLSADTVYTPGVHSAGSMNGAQSWMNTPITTPYGPSQPRLAVKSPWPAASTVPQSAPAHVLSFPREMSPPSMPSLPATPANMQFPQTQVPMHVMQTPMGPQVYPGIVPSQPGMSENPGFIPAQQSHFLQMQQALPWAPQAPWLQLGNDPYGEHTLWLMQNSCLPQKEIEVKLDAGCQKLKDEVSEGKAKLVRIRPQEFSFQNTTTTDMKKQFEERD